MRSRMTCVPRVAKPFTSVTQLTACPLTGGRGPLCGFQKGAPACVSLAQDSIFVWGAGWWLGCPKRDILLSLEQLRSEFQCHALESLAFTRQSWLLVCLLCGSISEGEPRTITSCPKVSSCQQEQNRKKSHLKIDPPFGNVCWRDFEYR